MPNFSDLIDCQQSAVPLAGGQFETLLSVFHQICGNLDLNPSDAPIARTVARAIIEAALSGEFDPDDLYDRALQAVRAS